jgi:hypothetical protein
MEPKYLGFNPIFPTYYLYNSEHSLPPFLYLGIISPLETFLKEALNEESA